MGYLLGKAYKMFRRGRDVVGGGGKGCGRGWGEGVW